MEPIKMTLIFKPKNEEEKNAIIKEVIDKAKCYSIRTSIIENIKDEDIVAVATD